MFRNHISPVPEMIDAVRNGKMVILVDDEERENEGDLYIPAQMCTPAAINFMAKHGRGLICLALTQKRAEELQIPMMTHFNSTPLRTAFTASIEAREGVSTGISAHDRAHTIAVVINPAKGPEDIVMPGHVFPLVAREGGVLVRTGHTEAAVDLSRLAGLHPSGVICEVMNDDGAMARLPDLVTFAQLHGIKIGTIADLIAHRRKHDHYVQRGAEAIFRSHHGGDWKLIVYVNNIEYAEHIALTKGDVSGQEPVLVRMHAINVLTDMLAEAHSVRDRLAESMRIIAQQGRGVVVLLRQARRTFVTDVVLKRSSEEDQRRVKESGLGAQILLDLGIRNMILLTDTPEKKVVALNGYGLNIVGTHPIRGGA